MTRVSQLLAILCLSFLISTIVLAIRDESLPRWRAKSQIPRWAEAETKRSRAGETVSPMADSAHSYDVLFYQLNLYFPITTRHLEGTALIRCRSEENSLDSIYLHLSDLTVDLVLVDGSEPYSWNHAGGRVTIHFTTPFSQNDTFEVLVSYGGTPSSAYYTTGSGQFITCYTFTAPSDSRFWFPCWDEPWDKADGGCEINAEVPLGFVVASNGLLTRVDTTYYPSNTTVTYRWMESYPISTYLMSVTIAKYKQILNYYVTATHDSVEVRHFVYAPDSILAETNFKETPDMMAFYASIFGEYPFGKYGMACVTNFWGGMEHQTMTTISSDAAAGGWEDIIVHELAHQWWGDMVTCFTWREVWLNEGFATYSEAMWHEHKYGFDSFRDKITSYGDDYLNGSYTHYALYDPPVLFIWRLVYTKGAWVLHMLRHMVGDAKYSEILQAYGEKFKYGNATTEDFRSIVDSVMNDTFNYYFQQWIYQPQHPQYEYGWRIQELGGENYLFDLRIRQTQQYGPLFSMPIDFRLGYTGGDTTFAVWVVADTFQEIELPLTLPPGSDSFNLAFDPDNWLLDEHEEVPYTSIDTEQSPAAEDLFILCQNAPNPFCCGTIIKYILPAADSTHNVYLAIYNTLGQCVRTLVNRGQGPGLHMVAWDGKDHQGNYVRCGIYFYQLQISNGVKKTKKMLLLR